MRRTLTIVLALIAITVTFGTVYAAISLTISNTATIVVGDPNLVMVTGMSSTTTCGSSSGIYTDTGLAIAWGNMKQAAAYDQYVCIHNTGVPHSLSITTTLQASQGIFKSNIAGSDANGQTLPNNGYALIDFTISVPPTAPTGPVSFDINVN